jgi:hypothetical protein
MSADGLGLGPEVTVPLQELRVGAGPAGDLRVCRRPTAPSLLAASWDAFDLLQVTASRFDDTATCRHAYAFLLATAAAARGRHSAGIAPSLPDGSAAPPDAEPFITVGEDQAVQAVAGLAELLESQLTVAGTSSVNPGDQVACIVRLGVEPASTTLGG